MKRKIIKFIIRYKLTYRFFMRFEWFRKLVVKVAEEILFEGINLEPYKPDKRIKPDYKFIVKRID